MRLKDKIIIITGGSGLIGKAILKKIDEESGIALNVDINVRTDFSKREVYCDITQSNSIDEMLAQVLSKYGRIDGLVNNGYPRTKDWF